MFTLLTAIFRFWCIDTQTANKAWQGAFFLCLVLAILTRHVNAILAGLLPVTLLLSLSLNIAGNLLRGNRIGSGKVILLRARFLKFALLGAGAILAANAVTILACRLTKTPYRSKIGATFEWRLDYLETISPNSQVQILKAIDHNLNDPAISYALGKTQELLAMRRSWDPTVIHRALFDILSAQGVTAWRALRFETDKRLNRIALQFLLTGGPQFWSVIIQDFWTSLNFSSADICREAFRTTDLLIHIDVGNSSRSIRHLATFQFQDQSYESRWSRNAFLTLGQSVRLWELMLIALCGAVWSCSLRQKCDPQFGIYLISLLITRSRDVFRELRSNLYGTAFCTASLLSGSCRTCNAFRDPLRLDFPATARPEQFAAQGKASSKRGRCPGYFEHISTASGLQCVQSIGHHADQIASGRMGGPRCARQLYLPRIREHTNDSRRNGKTRNGNGCDSRL